MELLPSNQQRAREIGRAAAHITIKVFKSLPRLAGAICLTAVGGVLVYLTWPEVLLPDEALLAKAIKISHSPSAADQRQTFLILLTVGMFLALAGVGLVLEWWERLRK